MPVFTQLTTADVASGSLMTAAKLAAVKTAMDGQIGLFDHFNWHYSNAASANKSFQDFSNAAANTVAYGADWYFVSDTGVAPVTRIGTKPASSVARITVTATAGDYGSAISRKMFQLDSVTAPVIFEGRFRIVTTLDRGYWIGLRNPTAATINESPATSRKGVQLIRSSATQGVFRAVDGGTTTGTAFTLPTLNTWFLVRIELDSASSARCYIDDVLTDTLTADVPADVPLAANIALGITSANADSLDCDWVSLTSGPLSLAA